MSGEERRAVIIDAAHSEFSRAGYHGASTARIAAAAECSEPMLYKHFSGKQELFTAVLKDTTRRLDQLANELMLHTGDNLIEQMAIGMPLLFRNPLYAGTMRMRMVAMTVIDLPGVREVLEGINQDMHASTIAAFERSEREGSAQRAREDADYIVWMWMGIQFAACYRDALHPGEFSAMLPHAERFIRSLLPGQAE
jgi:AcrR family transcriptional regulator